MTWLDDFARLSSERLDDRLVESLNARGVSDEQIQQFGIGYSTKELPPVEYPEHFLQWSHQGEKLDNVYCFPLTNPLGEIRGFQFRPVNRDVRGYQDYILDLGEPVLFGLGQAMPFIWANESVTLVEGVFDLFPIQRYDPTVMATLSAHVIESLFWTLRRMCRQVVLGWDNDATGRKNTHHFIKTHPKDFQIVDLGGRYPRLPLPGGKVTKDPGDLWEARGDVWMRDFVREHVSRHNGGEIHG